MFYMFLKFSKKSFPAVVLGMAKLEFFEVTWNDSLMLIHVRPMSQAAFLHAQKEIKNWKYSSILQKFKIVIIKTFTAMRATFRDKSFFGRCCFL